MHYLGIEYASTCISDANCLCIGSILEDLLYSKSRTLQFNTTVNVFGTGFMMCKEDNDEKFNRPVNIFALRGRMSLERCQAILDSKLESVVLGDPGLLVKRMFPDLKPTHSYDVGIICHFKDKDSLFIKNIQIQRKSFIFIDIFLPTKELVSEVVKCDFILSSALHGLICADAFGIPNKWLVISGNVEGEGYKFRDYYSVYGLASILQPVDIRKTVIKDNDIENYRVEYKDIDTQVDRICDELSIAFEHMKTIQG